MKVIADLRILEEQQVDSERKLQHARASKQRRLEQQAALEIKLDRLQYQNGQQRAELQRANELLSEGQRQINSARSAAAKAGDDLRSFDRKLKFAVEIKGSLLAHQRTQDRLLEDLRNRVGILSRLVKKEEEKCHAAQQEFDYARQYEKKLRQGIRSEAANQQRIADRTADVRSQKAALEHDLDLSFKLEQSLKLRTENIRLKEAEEQAHHADVEADFEVQKKCHHQFFLEMTDKKACLKETAIKKKSVLYQLWYETIEIQKAEGHTLSPPPTESNLPPVLDLERIRATVQAETDAAVEEAQAKEQLLYSVELLQKHLSELQVEQSTKTAKLQKLHGANDMGAKVEAARESSNDCLQSSLDRISKTVDEKNRQVLEIRSAQTGVIASLRKKLEGVKRKVQAVQESLEEHCRENADLDAEIIDVRTTYDSLKDVDQQKMDSMELELGEARQLNRDLLDETNRMKHVRMRSNETGEHRSRREETDQAHRTIADILESK